MNRLVQAGDMMAVSSEEEQSGLVAVNTLWLFFPVSRPKPPMDEIRLQRPQVCGEESGFDIREGKEQLVCRLA
jgi:hypothetical protein